MSLGRSSSPTYGAAQCARCNAFIVDEMRDGGLTCPICGIPAPPIAPGANVLDFSAWRPGATKRTGWLIKSRLAFAAQYNRGGAIAHLERVLDRADDRYRETVTMIHTGEVVHCCDEPLSQHRGHGSARRRTPDRE
jgi:hypothetical protein